MCHFITATLPKTAPLKALDAFALNLGRQFQPLSNPAVSAQLPSGSDYFLTTLGHCDCGTMSGSARRATAREPNWTQERAKLLTKGWSAAKVARALEQKRQSYPIKLPAQEEAGRGQSASITAFVSGVLESGLTLELGLLLRSYRRGLDEKFKIRLAHVPKGAALERVSPSAEEDVPYLFRAGV